MSTLKEIRFDAGLSLSQIARRANVSPVTVGRAEEGKPIQELKAVLIARALSELTGRQISVDDIEGLKVY